MPKKIKRQEIRTIDGQPCLVFVGEDNSEFYIPAMGIQATFDDAMRQTHAFAAQHGVTAGQWTPAMITTPKTWNTGTTDADAVAIIVDRGLPSEQMFALQPSWARELGDQLIETGKRLLRKRPSRGH